MKVKLIDVDLKYRSKRCRGKIFPNLALMKISAYEKFCGNEVGFDINNPDRTYVSCVFTKNRLEAIMECCNTFDTDRTFGGSGLSMDFSLPAQIEYIKPDYDLYPSTYSMGFTTRGCVRNCNFCIVRAKEGKFRRHQHISNFHNTRFKSCKLLDNNILADKEWFFDNTNWAIAHKVKLDITQGMDIRLLTPEIAAQLKRIRFVDQQIKFAWDNLIDERRITDGIAMLKEAGINTRRNVSFYVLGGFNSTIQEDIYRCNVLRDLRCHAFVMKYHSNNPILNHLARWSDKRELFWDTTAAEYLLGKGITEVAINEG